jgi:hypothetical protein
MEIETDGIVPEEEWMKVFRQIKFDVVGKDSFIKLDFGQIEDDDARGKYTGDSDLL